MSVKTKKKFDITNYTSLLSSLIAIVGGLVVAFIVLMLTNPTKGFSAFSTFDVAHPPIAVATAAPIMNSLLFMDSLSLMSKCQSTIEWLHQHIGSPAISSLPIISVPPL